MTHPQPLNRLIYVSRFSPHFPGEPEEQDLVLKAILRVSLRLNGDAGVTGLLLVHQRHFMQVLEGPAEAVTATYERILKDERHTDVRLLGVNRSERRAFPDWAMSVRRVNARDGSVLHAPEVAGAIDPSGLSFEGALGLLIGVRETRNRMILTAMA
jgi:hypothetical protein